MTSYRPDALIASDISAYLRLHQNKSLLRFITCGSVDDGKSTLIGRLLYDSKMIFEDQLASLEADSKRLGTQGQEIDFALLVDGLAAEREQGITIDVAYRYFSTPKRDFIIADSPGHEEYTRNMATGASTADLAILLIDARHGVVTQTRRHAFIVSLLGIRHVVLAVNKMDLVGWDRNKVEQIRRDFAEVNKIVGLRSVTLIPMSALNGDNVTSRSAATPWYDGPTLLEHLETVTLADEAKQQPLRLPVQLVTRPNLNFRGYQGTIAAGAVAAGDEIVVLPAGTKAKVKEVFDGDGEQPSLDAGRAVTITLDREIDASRGDLICAAAAPATVAARLRAHLVWFSHEPLTLHKHYRIKQATRHTNASVTAILNRIDVNTLAKLDARQLAMNDIALCELECARPLTFDAYATNRFTGSFVLIDRISGNTVAAGMIEGAAEAAGGGDTGPVTARERAQRFKQKPAVVALVGDAGNAAAVAAALDRALFNAGHLAAIVPAGAATFEAMRAIGAISIVVDSAEGATLSRVVAERDDPDTVARQLVDELEDREQISVEADFAI